MNLEIIAKGEISVERFFGQTVIYLPIEMGDSVSRTAIERILLEFFSQERLSKFQWDIYKGVHKGIGFYEIEFPSVLVYKSKKQPEFEIPDRIVERIQEEYSKSVKAK